MELNFELSAGDVILFSLLIPDQDPENILLQKVTKNGIMKNLSDQKSNF